MEVQVRAPRLVYEQQFPGLVHDAFDGGEVRSRPIIRGGSDEDGFSLGRALERVRYGPRRHAVVDVQLLVHFRLHVHGAGGAHDERAHRRLVAVARQNHGVARTQCGHEHRLISRGRSIDQEMRVVGAPSLRRQLVRFEQWSGRHVEVVEIADLREIDLEYVLADEVAHALVHAEALFVAGRVERRRAADHIVHEHVEIRGATLIESGHGKRLLSGCRRYTAGVMSGWEPRFTRIPRTAGRLAAAGAVVRDARSLGAQTAISRLSGRIHCARERFVAMRALCIVKAGGPEVLEICEVPTPEPKRDELLVRVRAAGVNRADTLQRRGHYPAPPGYPQDIPGLEFSGVVEAVGADVRRHRAGQRVFGLTGGGAQAEYLTIQETLALAVPETLTDVESGAIPEAYITAHDALFAQGSLQPGETVLIHAVGSGVGIAAMQI